MKHLRLWLFLAALLLLAALVWFRAPAGADGPGQAAVQWPSWTPVPTNTHRVYPSWTPVPTATSRRSATPSRTATAPKTLQATFTPWVKSTFTLPAPTATPTPACTPLPQSCETWAFTGHERLNIAAGARELMWGLYRTREEPPTQPWLDEILSIGWWAANLGAPMTDEYTLLSDCGYRIRCRGFAAAIVAVAESPDVAAECVRWAIIEWSGEARE